ncbi:enoyl-CoA hydratase/isomerase family protein [Caulobacter segnis]
MKRRHDPSVASRTFDRPRRTGRRPGQRPGHGRARPAAGDLAAVEADGAVRAVVPTGRHGASAPATTWPSSLSRDVETQTAAILHSLDMCDRIAACRVPRIAAVDGWCVGGGLGAGLGLRHPPGQRPRQLRLLGGAHGPTASAGRLVRLIGESRAKPHLLTGAPFDAARALADGVVAAVHPAAGLLDAALGMARVIASRAPLAVAATKRVASGVSTPPRPRSRRWPRAPITPRRGRRSWASGQRCLMDGEALQF